MNKKIINFLNDKFSDKVLFIGDVYTNEDKINFNVQIKESEIEIPETCQILNIDASLHFGTYFKIQINKSVLIDY